MKKLITLSLLFLPALAYEEVPLFIDTSIVNIEIEQDNPNSLINTNNIKKAESIRRNEKTPKQKIKIDTRQIHHQRALDYMNNKNGTMLPIF